MIAVRTMHVREFSKLDRHNASLGTGAVITGSEPNSSASLPRLTTGGIERIGESSLSHSVRKSISGSRNRNLLCVLSDLCGFEEEISHSVPGQEEYSPWEGSIVLLGRWAIGFQFRPAAPLTSLVLARSMRTSSPWPFTTNRPSAFGSNVLLRFSPCACQVKVNSEGRQR